MELRAAQVDVDSVKVRWHPGGDARCEQAGCWGVQFTASLPQPKGPLLGSLQGNWLLLWTVHHELMLWKHVRFHTYVFLSVSPSALNLTEWLWGINGTACDSMPFHLLVWRWRLKAIILMKILARAKGTWGPMISRDPLLSAPKFDQNKLSEILSLFSSSYSG